MQYDYNFNPGPATLPKEILEIAQTALMNYKKTGLSILEISHRSELFEEIVTDSETDLCKLLDIPTHYKILFLSGGARTQFAMAPMNLLGNNKHADYIDTGFWSQSAINEAKKYAAINLVCSANTNHYTSIPEPKHWQLNPNAAYVHYTSNETIQGLEFQYIPAVATPLVSDMSSNLLTRPLDVSKFGLIYACAQKNLGAAGITVVIVREDLLDQALPNTPSTLNYAIQAKEHSLYNTPPVFNWYVLSLTLKWLKKLGGLKIIEKLNQEKANSLYHFIDQSEFYINPVNTKDRSRMNVIFTLQKPELTETFLQESEEAGLYGLKGHPRLGGLRASIYNAMPQQGVETLLSFMSDFERKYT